MVANNNSSNSNQGWQSVVDSDNNPLFGVCTTRFIPIKTTTATSSTATVSNGEGQSTSNSTSTTGEVKSRLESLQVSLNIGDRVQVFRASSNGAAWYFGRCTRFNGTFLGMGIFPARCVKLLNEGEKKLLMASLIAPQQNRQATTVEDEAVVSGGEGKKSSRVAGISASSSVDSGLQEMTTSSTTTTQSTSFKKLVPSVDSLCQAKSNLRRTNFNMDLFPTLIRRRRRENSLSSNISSNSNDAATPIVMVDPMGSIVRAFDQSSPISYSSSSSSNNRRSNNNNKTSTNNGGNFEDEEGRLIAEVSQVLCHWNRRLKQILMEQKDYSLFWALYKLAKFILFARRQLDDIGESNLSRDELDRLEREIYRSIDMGNELLKADLLVRTGKEYGNSIPDWTNTSAIEVYNLYKNPNSSSSNESSTKLAITSSSTLLPSSSSSSSSSSSALNNNNSAEEKEIEELAKAGIECIEPPHQHIFMDMKAIVASIGNPGESTLLYFSIYDATEHRFITEPYVVVLTHSGMPRDEDKIGKLQTLFVDLCKSDLVSRALFLVCRIYRVSRKMMIGGADGSNGSNGGNSSNGISSSGGNSGNGGFFGGSGSSSSVSLSATNNNNKGYEESILSSSMGLLKRPFGLAVSPLSDLFKSKQAKSKPSTSASSSSTSESNKNNKNGSNKQSSKVDDNYVDLCMKIQTPTNESNFSTLHENVIATLMGVMPATGFESGSSSRAEMIAVSLRLYSGDQEALVQLNSVLSTCTITPRYGMPENNVYYLKNNGITNGSTNGVTNGVNNVDEESSIKNLASAAANTTSVHLQLVSGEFNQGHKSGSKNIQVTIQVRDNETGAFIPNCFLAENGIHSLVSNNNSNGEDLRKASFNSSSSSCTSPTNSNNNSVAETNGEDFVKRLSRCLLSKSGSKEGLRLALRNRSVSNTSATSSIESPSCNNGNGNESRGNGSSYESVYQSAVYYHSNSPKWNEPIKLEVRSDLLTHCHLFFTLKHISTNGDGKTRAFAFSFLPLYSGNQPSDEVTLPDALHTLVMYKYDESVLMMMSDDSASNQMQQQQQQIVPPPYLKGEWPPLVISAYQALLEGSSAAASLASSSILSSALSASGLLHELGTLNNRNNEEATDSSEINTSTSSSANASDLSSNNPSAGMNNSSSSPDNNNNTGNNGIGSNSSNSNYYNYAGHLVESGQQGGVGRERIGNIVTGPDSFKFYPTNANNNATSSNIKTILSKNAFNRDFLQVRTRITSNDLVASKALSNLLRWKSLKTTLRLTTILEDFCSCKQQSAIEQSQLEFEIVKSFPRVLMAIFEIWKFAYRQGDNNTNVGTSSGGGSTSPIQQSGQFKKLINSSSTHSNNRRDSVLLEAFDRSKLISGRGGSLSKVQRLAFQAFVTVIKVLVRSKYARATLPLLDQFVSQCCSSSNNNGNNGNSNVASSSSSSPFASTAPHLSGELLSLIAFYILNSLVHLTQTSSVDEESAKILRDCISVFQHIFKFVNSSWEAYLSNLNNNNSNGNNGNAAIMQENDALKNSLRTIFTNLNKFVAESFDQGGRIGGGTLWRMQVMVISNFANVFSTLHHNNNSGNGNSKVSNSSNSSSSVVAVRFFEPSELADLAVAFCESIPIARLNQLNPQLNLFKELTRTELFTGHPEARDRIVAMICRKMKVSLALCMSSANEDVNNSASIAEEGEDPSNIAALSSSESALKQMALDVKRTKALINLDLTVSVTVQILSDIIAQYLKITNSTGSSCTSIKHLTCLLPELLEFYVRVLNGSNSPLSNVAVVERGNSNGGKHGKSTKPLQSTPASTSLGGALGRSRTLLLKKSSNSGGGVSTNQANTGALKKKNQPASSASSSAYSYSSSFDTGSLVSLLLTIYQILPHSFKLTMNASALKEEVIASSESNTNSNSNGSALLNNPSTPTTGSTSSTLFTSLADMLRPCNEAEKLRNLSHLFFFVKSMLNNASSNNASSNNGNSNKTSQVPQNWIVFRIFQAKIVFKILQQIYFYAIEEFSGTFGDSTTTSVSDKRTSSSSQLSSISTISTARKGAAINPDCPRYRDQVWIPFFLLLVDFLSLDLFHRSSEVDEEGEEEDDDVMGSVFSGIYRETSEILGQVWELFVSRCAPIAPPPPKNDDNSSLSVAPISPDYFYDFYEDLLPPIIALSLLKQPTGNSNSNNNGKNIALQVYFFMLRQEFAVTGAFSAVQVITFLTLEKHIMMLSSSSPLSTTASACDGDQVKLFSNSFVELNALAQLVCRFEKYARDFNDTLIAIFQETCALINGSGSNGSVVEGGFEGFKREFPCFLDSMKDVLTGLLKLRSIPGGAKNCGAAPSSGANANNTGNERKNSSSIFYSAATTIATDEEEYSDDLDDSFEDERCLAKYELIETCQLDKKASKHFAQIYARYVMEICCSNERRSLFVEAGHAISKLARGLEFNLHSRVPALEPYFPEQSAFERKEAIYYRMSSLFERGQAWEEAIKVFRELAHQYENVVYDYVKLGKVLSRQSSCFQNIVKRADERFACYPEYFRVAYYGGGFPLFFRNRQFVYRALPFEKLASFCDRIVGRHEMALLMKSNGQPDASIIGDETGQHLQIVSVKGGKNSGKNGKNNIAAALESDDSAPYEELMVKNSELDEMFSQLVATQSKFLNVSNILPSSVIAASAASSSTPAVMVPEAIKKYLDSTDLKEFFFARPYKKKNGSASPAPVNEFANLWVEKSILTVRDEFPFALCLSPVERSVTLQLEPIFNAIQTVQGKSFEIMSLSLAALDHIKRQAASASSAVNGSSSLVNVSGSNKTNAPGAKVKSSKAINKYDYEGEDDDESEGNGSTQKVYNSSPFTMALNGAVDAAVQGGIRMYQEAFLTSTSNSSTTSATDKVMIDLLSQTIQHHKIVLGLALQVHEQVVVPELYALHEKMINFYHQGGASGNNA